MGAATAKLFQAAGATVVVTGSNPETLEAARQELTGIEVVASDASDPAAAKALVEGVKARHGRLDVLFANAGVARMAPIPMVDEAFFDFTFNVNVRGVYFLLKYAAAVMQEGGSIILNSSIGAGRGTPGMSVYGASKAAVRSFGRNFAAELAPRGIRVNTISPGAIETPIWGKIGMSAEQMEGLQKRFATEIPLKRPGRGEEVAAAALFFASDASSFTTGADLPVDGGTLDIG